MSHPNPAWQFKQRTEAKAKLAVAQAEAPAAGGKANREFDLLLTSIENDLRRLGTTPKGSARNKVKREVMMQYLPHLAKYEKDGDNYANPVMVQVMIWAFDIGEMELALSLARLGADQKQQLPERFTRRDIPTFAADATLEWAKGQLQLKLPIEPHFGDVLALIETDWQVHDEIKVKFLRLKADSLEATDPAKALAICHQILSLDPGAKLKTLIERLEKTVAKQTPPPPAAGA